jgi:branched-subunit amino acid transport protein
MEGALNVWIVIFAVGALNYLSRLSFIAAFGRRSMPAWLARSLRFVPAAMLTALILPMIAVAPAPDAIAWANPKVPAAIVAAVVSRRSRRGCSRSGSCSGCRAGSADVDAAPGTRDRRAGFRLTSRLSTGRTPCASKAPIPTSRRPT